MDFNRLEESITYGGETSGFTEGKIVRGLFGRGLKEAILALGTGKIVTAYNGNEIEIILRIDDKGVPVREIKKESHVSTRANGTDVLIRVKYTKYKCPTFEKLYNQMTDHYVLREILSNPKRKIFLCMKNPGIQRGEGNDRNIRTKMLKYKPIGGTKVEEKNYQLKGLGNTRIELYESNEKLFFSKGNPCSRAGLVIKTLGAVLDLSLFGFESDESSHFFWGFVYCPDISELIRKGDFSIINSTRTGLHWDYPYCQELYNSVRDFIKPHILRKNSELSKVIRNPQNDKYNQKIKDICALLNRLAREEEMTATHLSGPAEDDLDPESVQLAVKPSPFAYAPPDVYRTFRVYLNKRFLLFGKEPLIEIELIHSPAKFELQNNPLLLHQDKNHEYLFSGDFKIKGRSEGDRTDIQCKFEDLMDETTFVVRQPGQKKHEVDRKEQRDIHKHFI